MAFGMSDTPGCSAFFFLFFPSVIFALVMMLVVSLCLLLVAVLLRTILVCTSCCCCSSVVDVFQLNEAWHRMLPDVCTVCCRQLSLWCCDVVELAVAAAIVSAVAAVQVFQCLYAMIRTATTVVVAETFHHLRILRIIITTHKRTASNPRTYSTTMPSLLQQAVLSLSKPHPDEGLPSYRYTYSHVTYQEYVHKP